MFRFIQHTILFLCFFGLSLEYGEAQSRKERKALFESMSNYEIQMLGVGQDGTKVFKIYAYGKKVEDAILQAKRLAVHACLFRGLPGSKSTNATPAICKPEIETENKEFFQSFFKIGGDYLDYVNVTTDGFPSGQDRVKIKKGYKVGVKVQILYDNLRKAMEEKGYATRLDSLF